MIVIGVAWWIYKQIKELRPQKRIETLPKKYRGLQDWKDDTETIWEGRPRTVSFTYKPHHDYKSKERRTVHVKRVLRDGRGYLYLQGHCEKRNEQRTFRLENITTMIMDGKNRLTAADWLGEKCGLNDVTIQ